MCTNCPFDMYVDFRSIVLAFILITYTSTHIYIYVSIIILSLLDLFINILPLSMVLGQITVLEIYRLSNLDQIVSVRAHV